MIIVIVWVLSGAPRAYGAATAQVFAIYEIFPVLVVSVLLLFNPLFFLKTHSKRKEVAIRFCSVKVADRFLTLFFMQGGPVEVNKKQLSQIFGVSVRTVQNWQEQGMPVVSGGGKGNEVLYESAAVIEWYSARDAIIENEKLRKEVEELRQAGEADLQPGTIDYERYRLTRAQADAQELKNARESAEVVDTTFCTFVLSKMAGEIASILDGIPLSVQRRFPDLENRHIDFLKTGIIRAMNKAAALDEMIPGLLSEYLEQSD